MVMMMKICNSKKELASIISENGGWLCADFAAQQDDGEVWFSSVKPEWNTGRGCFSMRYESHFTVGTLIHNRHQCILSRAEYFHLYPAPDAEPEFCESVMRSIPEPEAKPTIEQLAADYRNAKDYAERKQQEADDAKVDADARLAELIYAGEALGLMVSPITTKQEPELVITDWRDLQENDWIWYGGDIETPKGEYQVIEIEVPDYMGYKAVKVDAVGPDNWIDTSEEWRFIRRP